MFCLICVPTTIFGFFKSEERPTVTFLSNTSIGLGGKRFLWLKVCNSGLYILNVPWPVMNFALYALYLRSSNWDAVQVDAFCDLNREPVDGCLLITTFASSGKSFVRISSSPTRHIHAWYSWVDAKITKAYSAAGRYTGKSNLKLVGTVPLSDVLTWLGSKTLLAIERVVGYPFSTWTNLTSTGIFLLFVKKNISTDVMNIPGYSVTLNDCANGSSSPPPSSSSIIIGGGGGGGGGAIRFIVVCVINSPLEKKFELALLIGNSPGFGVTSPLAALIATVLLPLVKLGLPVGIWIDPSNAPNSSEINLTSLTCASALLVSPTSLISLTILPKNLSSDFWFKLPVSTFISVLVSL